MHIFDFNEENLSVALSNDFTSSAVVKSKTHFSYLLKYLGSEGIDVKTIVIEETYISKDYLHDYASYYALCFKDYPKSCKRVHFFKTTFGSEEFKNILTSEKNNLEFWDSYAGFIVVKPIPITIIGYTVLKPYEHGSEFNKRNFWGLRTYAIHVFGHEVLLDSLAFQEQDSVLSACATTAIWTMLNKAATDFHTILKSPSQITKDADNVSPDGGRLFPNKGLNLLQICNAIVNSGLVSEIKQPDITLYNEIGESIGAFVSSTYLKKILNAYSPIGIPIILVIKVPNGNQIGMHAIVVSGYKQNAPAHIAPEEKINFLSENIEKIYAHDDQWGPFVRIDFENDADLITPWSVTSEAKLPTRLANIVIPVYPKIRISYEDIEVIVRGFDTILTLFFSDKIVADLVWDIKINFSENFKNQIINSSLDEEVKFYHIFKSLPKYIWVASCFVSGNKILDFSFDATDVNSGMIAISIISYLPDEFKTVLSDFLKNNQPLLQPLLQHKAREDYYHFFLKELS